MYAFINIHTCICTYNICIHSYVYVCIHMYIFVYICADIDIHMYLCKYVYT